ncbi:hypothetical protein [Streptomyces sp. NPDC102282]|uniref:hypothetical protein n=1 Tax=Streptomyces sp. NPDC102282 TaxID=3366154 RepID=UPI0038223B3F
MSDSQPQPKPTSGGFVVTEKNAAGTGTTTTIVTTQGVSTHECPGGLTNDEIID